VKLQQAIHLEDKSNISLAGTQWLWQFVYTLQKCNDNTAGLGCNVLLITK